MSLRVIEVAAVVPATSFHTVRKKAPWKSTSISNQQLMFLTHADRYVCKCEEF